MYDALISGGGMVGSTMLASLLHLRQNIKSNKRASSLLSRLMLVDTGARPVYDPANMMHRLRTVSITPVSSKIVENVGVWSRLTTKHPYYRIAIRHEKMNDPLLSQGHHSHSFFMSRILGNRVTSEPLVQFTDLRRPVGYICYNVELQASMMARVQDLINNESDSNTGEDRILFETNMTNVQLPPNNIESGPLGSATITRNKSDGCSEEVKFKLLLGCEGRGSSLREAFRMPSFQKDYGQTAFVCEARLATVADGNVCSFQNFFCDGKIIAFLPTSKDSANIVFSTTPEQAAQLQDATQQALVQELNRRLHDFAPEDIPKILEIPEGSFNGKQCRVQGTFPLKLSVVTTPYVSRAVLLGDAAHGIHPFAGQGVNLGIYDVCALTNTLEKTLDLGQDIGSVLRVGQVFAGEMIAHTAPMIASMEAIKAMTYLTPSLSCVGMKILNNLPLLSTFGKDAVLHLASGASFAKRHQRCFLLK